VQWRRMLGADRHGVKPRSTRRHDLQDNQAQRTGQVKKLAAFHAAFAPTAKLAATRVDGP
jgi:hypothetical protein